MATYDLTSSIPKYYLLRAGDILNCPYSGNKKIVQLPAGLYKFECWGALGGTGYTSINSPSLNNKVNITSNNFSSYFDRTISSYHFVPDINGIWSANNLTINNSTALTILVCKIAGYYLFTYSYTTELNFDKFTLIVGGTTVANALSGTSSNNTYFKYLNVNDQVIMTYAKDSSVSASGESVTVTIAEGSSLDYSLANFSSFSTYNGGKGGYSYLIAILKLAHTTLYCYAGGQGQSSYSTTRGDNAGGFNGGGSGGRRWYLDIYTSGGGGGGASDIRIGTDSYNLRVVVAGGGGGAAGLHDDLKYGGGATGYCNNSTYRSTRYQAGSGGAFGQGASTTLGTNYKYGAGGGGGGWYGGGALTGFNDGDSTYREQNAGGSGYYSFNVYQNEYDLTSGNTIAGDTSFTSPTGASETGHSGNGYIRITILSIGFTSNNLNISSPGSYSKKFNPGKYKLECWGARGGGQQDGNSAAGPGGLGGYSYGNLTLLRPTTLHCYSGGIGAVGYESLSSGGFNGGGSAWGSSSSEPGCGGGGASDIRINSTSLYARVIVAGGGGGGGEDSGDSVGYGGGLSGGTGGAAGGNQTSGGNFGQGRHAYDGGGGGGGWYGGLTASNLTSPPSGTGADNQGGGGGSGYVYTSSTASNYPSGCLLDSKYYLENALTIGGNVSFTSPTGSSETGHNGTGYVRITLLNVDEGVENISDYNNCFYYNSNTSRYETNKTPLTDFSAYYRGRVKKNVKIKFTFGAETNLSDIGSYWMSQFSILINGNNFLDYYITLEQRTVSFEVALKAGDLIYMYCYSPDLTLISGLTKRIPYFTMTYTNLSYTPVFVPEPLTTIQYNGNTRYFASDILRDNSDYGILYSINGGTTSASKAGNYTTILSLIDATNTKWSDGTTSNKTIEWKINPATSYLLILDPHYIVVENSVNLAVLYNGDYSNLSFVSNDNTIVSIGDLIAGDNQGRGITIQANKIGRAMITINNNNDSNYAHISKSIVVKVISSPYNCVIKKGKLIIIPLTSTFMGNFETPNGAVIGPLSFPPGRYKLECWGAQGGIASGRYSGTNSTGNNRGGYTSGVLTLTKTTPLWFGVGGSGIAGGFNGGGKRQNYPAGGGGTDIRIGSNSLYARVIVAGGGGSEGGYKGYQGGAGGGLNATLYNSNTTSGGYGGNQTGVNNNWIKDALSNGYSTQLDCYGGFGFGGNGITIKSGAVGIGVVSGAGGGGWYGGAGTYTTDTSQLGSGGGGGSNYVYTSSTAVNYPSGCLLTPNYYLSDTISKTGLEYILLPDLLNTQIGNYGDGVIIITVLDGPTDEYIKDNGEWYRIKDTYVKINNEWKLIKDFQVNYNGRWLTQNE